MKLVNTLCIKVMPIVYLAQALSMRILYSLCIGVNVCQWHTRDPLLKYKVQYYLPPLDQLLLKMQTLFLFLQNRATLMRRSTVQSLSLQLVFLAIHTVYSQQKIYNTGLPALAFNTNLHFFSFSLSPCSIKTH